MREVIKLGLVLLIITSIAAVVLAFSNDYTKDIIADVEEKVNNDARMEVLPQAKDFKPLDEQQFKKLQDENNKIIEIYVGYSESENIAGYTIKTATPGYGGDVLVITGISSEGKLTGMKVVSHQETPGLGANSTKPDFQEQFEGKLVDSEITVVKSSPSSENEIQAITGATITSRAVTSGVNIAREIFYSEFSK
jgi:H+/Na+-translocating ferredoxin:NAD+ oxidoreductase subunit G